MQTNIRTEAARSASASSAYQLYTLAGISALLYVLVSLAVIPLTDWNNPAATTSVTLVLNVLGYAALLPVVLGVYQHLRSASTALSSVAIVSGVLALVGGATGAVVGFDTKLGMVSGMIASFGMLLFFGLSGYLALTGRLLPAGWALLSILIGVMAVSAGIISGVAGSNSVITGLAWTVFSLTTVVWAVWTAAEFIRRGRADSSIG